jgi:hypothetical protein
MLIKGVKIMDAQKREHNDSESRFYFINFITPQLKNFLAQRIVWLCEAGRKQTMGQRFQFDLNLYREYLVEACREAERLDLIPANSRLEVAIIMGSDEQFYRKVHSISEKL